MILGISNTSSSLQFMETQTYSGTCLQVLTITFLLARRKLERCRELRGHWISHARMIKVYFRAERQSQSKVLLLVPNWTAWKGVVVGGITKLHNRQLYWHLKFNSEFDGCNTPKMRSDQGASNTPDKKQWPISFSFQISFFFKSISYLTSDLCSLLSGRPYGWDSIHPGSAFQSPEHSLWCQMMSLVQDGSGRVHVISWTHMSHSPPVHTLHTPSGYCQHDWHHF